VMKERGERRRNILLKELKVGEEGMKKSVEEILARLGEDIIIEEIRMVQAGKMERGKLIVVRLKSEDMRRRVLMNKWKLKGGDIWLEEDLTWEERRIRWRIRRTARVEGKGKRVRMAQWVIWLEGVWWGLDEEEDGLRDPKGRRWGEGERRRESGEEKEGDTRVIQCQGE